MLLLTFALLLLFLCFANLSGYPAISGWDEGIYLQFASNLIHHGEYATHEGNTFNRLIPAGGTGLTVILPVALALQIGHDSLFAARLVIATYLFIAVAGAYVLMHCIGDWLTALVGCLLFLFAGCGMHNTLWLGRQVLAEAPAFAFLFLGLWMWIRSWGDQRRWLIGSALLFGLAAMSKNQLIGQLAPAFILLALIDRFYYRQLRWSHRLAPLAGTLAGYALSAAAVFVIVGANQYDTYQESQDALTGATFLHFTIQRWIGNIAFVYHSGQWWLILIALLYGLVRGRARSLAGLRHLTLPIFAGTALVFFIILGLPWARYLYPALAFSALYSAVFFVDLARQVGAHQKSGGIWTAGITALSLLLVVGPCGVRDTHAILTTQDTNAARFAHVVNQMVPADAEILNWEWEIEFYSDRVYRHPPFVLFPAMIDQKYNQRLSPILDQPRIPSEIQYLIIGPWSKDRDTFTAELVQRPHQLLAQEGSYELYSLSPQER